MPTKSKAQQKLMLAAAHNKAFAKKVGVPQDVAEEFVKADMKAGLIHQKGKQNGKKVT